MITRVAIACLLFASIASAQHSDVLLRSDGSQTLIGAAEDIGEVDQSFDLETNVFEGVFIPGNPMLGDPALVRDEPGFFSSPVATVGQDLPGNADVSVAFSPFSLPGGSDSVFFWNGQSAEPDFEPLSTTQPAVTFSLGGSPFGMTAADGSIDEHPDFGLDGPFADGAYLVGLTATVDGLDASEPFYMVWLADQLIGDEDDAEALEELFELFEAGGAEPEFGGKNFAFFEEAVEFAEAIPEPSAMLLLLVSLTGVAASHR